MLQLLSEIHVPVSLNGFQPCLCSCSVHTFCQNFSSGRFFVDAGAKTFILFRCFQLMSTGSERGLDWTLAVCLELRPLDACYIPYLIHVLLKRFISSVSASLPPSPSVSQANKDLLIAVECPSRTSIIMRSREMPKIAGDRRQPWQTSTDLWSQSPTVAHTRPALLAYAFGSCTVFVVL